MTDEKKSKEEEPRVKMYQLAIKLDIEAPSIDEARNEVKTRIAELLKMNPEKDIQRVVRKKHSSRADRLSVAQSMISDARGIVEELKDEISEWRDNLPENLQGSEKYSALDECASNLETLEGNLDEAESACDTVEFPGMFG